MPSTNIFIRQLSEKDLVALYNLSKKHPGKVRGMPIVQCGYNHIKAMGPCVYHTPIDGSDFIVSEDDPVMRASLNTVIQRIPVMMSLFAVAVENYTQSHLVENDKSIFIHHDESGQRIGVGVPGAPGFIITYKGQVK